MNKFRFALTAAAPGNSAYIDAQTSFIRYTEETSGAANPAITVTTSDGLSFDLKPGESSRINKLSERIKLENRDGLQALAGSFAIGGLSEWILGILNLVDIEDRVGRLLGIVSLAKPQTINTVADVALAAGVATQILPLDAARQQALISNLTGNANRIRVGDVNVGAARGVEVSPGQTITLAGTQAIFGFSAVLESVGVVVIKD